MRLLLSLNDIETALNNLPGWKREGGELVKTYRFSKYLSGIEFVNHVAQAAEKLNHHPELYVGWCKVQVKLTTHSAGGITKLDVQMAENAERFNQEIDSESTSGSEGAKTEG